MFGALRDLMLISIGGNRRMEATGVSVLLVTPESEYLEYLLRPKVEGGKRERDFPEKQAKIQDILSVVW